MSYEIELVDMPATLMAAVRAKTDRAALGKTIRSSFDIVYAFLRQNSIRHLGLNVVVYFDGEINIECGVREPEPFESTGEVRCTTTPSGRAAHVVYFGPYTEMAEAYATLDAWCKEHGQKRVGPSWEAYGHWNDDPAQLRTDIYDLVAEV
jgi:effector-binding domain-containing protein